MTLLTIGKSLDSFPDIPVLTSRSRVWSDVVIDVHPSRPDFSLEVPALDHHVITLALRGGGRLQQKRGDRIHESVIRSGQMMVVPAYQESSWSGAVVHSVGVRIPALFLDRASAELSPAPNRPAELRHVYQAQDPTIKQLCEILLHELDAPEHPAQRLLTDSISTALAVHLLRRYEIFGITNRQPAKGLGPAVLNRVVDYIEDHLGATISLDELAAVAGVSRFHFSRMFKASTSMTPMAYVERARLGRAKEMIRSTNMPLAAIALAVGFRDQSHFGRRFFSWIGVTPGVFARNHRGA